MKFKTMNEEMNCSAGLDAKPTGADVNLRDPVAASDVGHTPGPWRTHDALVFFPDNAGGFSLQNCPAPEANARRIVAAINACEGISNKGLEKPTLFGAIGAERDRLRIERDQTQSDKKILSAWCYDLRVAVKILLPLAESYLKDAPSSPDNAKLETARGALAKTHHLEAI